MREHKKFGTVWGCAMVAASWKQTRGYSSKMNENRRHVGSRENPKFGSSDRSAGDYTDSRAMNYSYDRSRVIHFDLNGGKQRKAKLESLGSRARQGEYGSRDCRTTLRGFAAKLI